MLEALMTEDMYLAGSMLMVLSLLGIFERWSTTSSCSGLIHAFAWKGEGAMNTAAATPPETAGTAPASLSQWELIKKLSCVIAWR